MDGPVESPHARRACAASPPRARQAQARGSQSSRPAGARGCARMCVRARVHMCVHLCACFVSSSYSGAFCLGTRVGASVRVCSHAVWASLGGRERVGCEAGAKLALVVRRFVIHAMRVRDLIQGPASCIAQGRGRRCSALFRRIGPVLVDRYAVMSHVAYCMSYSALVFGLGLVLVDRLGHLLYQDSGAAQSLGRSVVVPDEPANKR